ncbi:MAG: hypothetical protein WCQ47_04655 [bacterium]
MKLQRKAKTVNILLMLKRDRNKERAFIPVLRTFKGQTIKQNVNKLPEVAGVT